MQPDTQRAALQALPDNVPGYGLELYEQGRNLERCLLLDEGDVLVPEVEVTEQRLLIRPEDGLQPVFQVKVNMLSQFLCLFW